MAQVPLHILHNALDSAQRELEDMHEENKYTPFGDFYTEEDIERKEAEIQELEELMEQADEA